MATKTFTLKRDIKARCWTLNRGAIHFPLPWTLDANPDEIVEDVTRQIMDNPSLQFQLGLLGECGYHIRQAD